MRSHQACRTQKAPDQRHRQPKAQRFLDPIVALMSMEMVCFSMQFRLLLCFLAAAQMPAADRLFNLHDGQHSQG